MTATSLAWLGRDAKVALQCERPELSEVDEALVDLADSLVQPIPGTVRRQIEEQVKQGCVTIDEEQRLFLEKLRGD